MAEFRPLAPLTARWRSWDGDGLEHLSLRPEGDRIVAESVVVGHRNGTDYGVRYRIVCDPDWRVESLDLATVGGREVHVRSEREGAWTDAKGHPLAKFDGCGWIDLEGSPITNMLAIRRLGPSLDNDPSEIRALYVPFDSFEPFVDEQRYTCIEPTRRYRYEAVDGSFEAEIEVDEDGLVTTYPPLFRRVPLS